MVILNNGIFGSKTSASLVKNNKYYSWNSNLLYNYMTKITLMKDESVEKLWDVAFISREAIVWARSTDVLKVLI